MKFKLQHFYAFYTLIQYSGSSMGFGFLIKNTIIA